jgi:hypothetical protein
MIELVFNINCKIKVIIQKEIAMLPTSPAKHFARFRKLKNRKTPQAMIG